MNQRGQSTVEPMMGFSAVVLAVVLFGYVSPDGFDALVIAIAEWITTFVEIP